MASAPSEPPPVLGKVDSAGRLIEADPRLAELQADAGSRIGAVLAIPQIAAVVRLARRLAVPVTRPAMAAARDRDIDLIVTALPEDGDIRLVLEGWTERAPSGPRLTPVFGGESGAGPAPQHGHWSADEQLRLIDLSPEIASALGIERGEAIGQPLTRIVKLDEDENGEMPLLAALAARRGFDGQKVTARKGSGSAFTLSGEVVLASDGSFSGFEGRAELSGQAGEPPRITPPSPVSSSIDEVLDEALRSPIDRIIECADQIVARSEGESPTDYAAYAADISAAARHLLSVIRSMGEEARREGSTVDLTAIAAEAVVMLETAAESRNVSIGLSPSSPLPALGDERGVIQILVNLIGNAIRHSPEGGAITVTFEQDASRARVHVADEGPGIDPSDQQRIFERFERAGSEGGTGLGLAISRRLARSMDGDVTLESRPGEGAQFTLELKRA